VRRGDDELRAALAQGTLGVLNLHGRRRHARPARPDRRAADDRRASNQVRRLIEVLGWDTDPDVAPAPMPA
jgi:hypothetical protein